MPAFRYRAVDPVGKTQSGLVEAATPAAARAALRGRGLTPVDLAATVAATPAGAAPRAALGRNGPRLPVQALTLVTRQLATLLGSGLRVEEALATVASGQPPRTGAVLLAVRAQVLEGRTVADALAAFPRVFSEDYRASVRAGEAAGRLDQVMRGLADHVENRARSRQTVQLALLYPALLAVISVGIILFLMTFVMPDIIRVFTARGADLPFLTRALIVLSEGLRGWGLVLVAALVLGVAGAWRLLRVPANRRAWDRRMVGSRLVGRIVRRTNTAQFAATLATLLQSGVTLVDALGAAGGVVRNTEMRARVQAMTEEVRRGSSLRRAMAEAGVFPPMLVAMVASGEASGNLAQAIGHAAADQQRDMDAWVKASVALVEPLILLVMGGLVMAMVLAILLPIVSLNSLVGG